MARGTGGADPPHIDTLIDDLLAAEKELAGEAFWSLGNRPDEQRLDWPILVRGETTNCRVSVTAYPNSPDSRFTITLNYENRNVWRLDFEPPDRIEVNPYLRGHELSNVTVFGPHYHSWEDNRHEATPAAIPEKLPWKRPLPPGVKSWESAFRWFLGETNVAQPQAIPALPARTRLV